MAKVGRTALVTGAGKGLGAAFANGLARDGCAVIINNRSHDGKENSAESFAANLRQRGYEATADSLAVDKPGAAQKIISSILTQYGSLDVLVLNAGIAGPAAKVGSLKDRDIRHVMEVNFHANTALVDAALPYLLESSSGRIVFVASSAGLYGVRGRAAYAASKGAIVAYARSLAAELADTDIRVNILAPYAATAMTKAIAETSDPMLEPQYATAAAVWLCRPECERTGEIWTTGANYFCRTAVVEGLGGGSAEADPEWFGRHADQLATLTGGQEYGGAEAAFTDFLRRSNTK